MGGLQEWLGKVGLDPIRLVVDIVVVGIIVEEQLARVPPDTVSAMVVDRLCARDRKQQRSLSDRKTRALFREDSSDRVEHETFEGVVVERTKRVGHVEAVMDRVEMSVEEAVRVTEPVKGVLPSVNDKAAG